MIVVYNVGVVCQCLIITNTSTRFATFGILGFFECTVLSGKFELNLHGSKRVMQALYHLPKSLTHSQYLLSMMYIMSSFEMENIYERNPNKSIVEK